MDPQQQLLPSSARRACLLVLGMHRSGTSALTRVLSLCGAALPDNVLGADDYNQRGHWEPTHIIEHHDHLLRELGSSWRDWRSLDLARMHEAQRQRLAEEMICRINEEFPGRDFFVLKEPRLCRLAPLLLAGFDRAGIDPFILMPIRNPLEVAESLAERNGMPLAEAAFLWLRHVLDAEHATRGRPRAFLSYDALLTEWRGTLAHAFSIVGLPWREPAPAVADEVSSFLAPDLRHHKRDERDLSTDPVLAYWVHDSFKALSLLERDPNCKLSARVMDRIRSEFDQASPLIHRLVTDLTPSDPV